MKLATADIEALYRSHGQMVLRRARTLLHDDAAAEDVTHEVFAALLAHPDGFEGRSKMSTFLYAMTTNRCLSRLRDAKNRQRIIDLRVAPAAARDAAPLGEKRAVLRDLLARVPEELAQVAIYFYVDSMTYEQIAEVLGRSSRHVADLLQRFRERAGALVKEAA